MTSPIPGSTSLLMYPPPLSETPSTAPADVIWWVVTSASSWRPSTAIAKGAAVAASEAAMAMAKRPDR
jgi:hypothetical protein